MGEGGKNLSRCKGAADLSTFQVEFDGFVPIFKTLGRLRID